MSMPRPSLPTGTLITERATMVTSVMIAFLPTSSRPSKALIQPTRITRTPIALSWPATVMLRNNSVTLVRALTMMATMLVVQVQLLEPNTSTPTINC